MTAVSSFARPTPVQPHGHPWWGAPASRSMPGPPSPCRAARWGGTLTRYESGSGRPAWRRRSWWNQVVAALAELRPDVPVDVEFATSVQLLAALNRGELDMTVALLPLDGPDIRVLPLGRYPFRVVGTPTMNSLSGQSSAPRTSPDAGS